MYPISQFIRYVGTQDDTLDLFEGQYPVPDGISYNSYFVADTASAVIDSVDARRTGDWLAAIERNVENTGCTPAYLIIQHVEPDHTGSVRHFIERYPDAKLVMTAKALAMLDNFFEDVDFSARHIIVGDGDTLTLGRTTLRFITAPMVHWPEVMMTLSVADRVLFSADAFGTFSLSNTLDGWDDEARRYYSNIVGRFGASVQAVMKKLAPLEFDVVAPLHGPALRDNLARYWTLYDKWSRYEPESRGVLIAYASIYGGTAEAARRLGALLEEKGAEVALIDLCRRHVSYAVSLAFKYSHMALCSVTYDGDILPAMNDFLHHIERKNLCNRTVGLIQNGTWAPTAGRIMAAKLAQMKGMTVIEPTVTLRSRMQSSDLNSLNILADRLLES